MFFLHGLRYRIVKHLGYSHSLCCLFFISVQLLILLQFKDQLLLFLKLLPLLLNHTLLEGVTVLKTTTVSRRCLWAGCLKMLENCGYLIPVRSLVLGTQGCMFNGNLPGTFGGSVEMRCVNNIPTRLVSGLIRLFLYETSFSWLGEKQKEMRKIWH